MSILRLENIKKTYECGPQVLRGISLTVEEGEVVAIIGPSGGGKSTLLRCMIDLEEVTGGSIYVGEEALVKDGRYCAKADRARLISEMGMVFQSFNLFPHMTVRENLIKPYLLNRPNAADAEQKCEALLEKVGLAEKKDDPEAKKALYSRLIRLYVGDLLQNGEQNEWALARATAILKEHRAQLDGLSDLLVEKETIDRAEFVAFLKGEPCPEKKEENVLREPEQV